MDKQKVYLSKTFTNTLGLFTARTLVFSLDKEDLTKERIEQIVAKCGFEYSGNLDFDIDMMR